MAAGIVTRWARRFVAVSAVLLVAWQVAALADTPRPVRIALAVHGFVLHTVFGKAYSLVPSYFDRELAVPPAPAVQLPLTVVGATGVALAPLSAVPGFVGRFGALCWAAGVTVFVAALAWTLRDNPTGRETGTGEANAHRRRVDRFANAFVPVVLVYLLAGTVWTVADRGALAASSPVAFARTAHLLAAGTAALLVFAVGFRLFPRFLVADPPRPLVAAVLPAGAMGPAVLAWGLYRGPWFRVGATLEAVAVVGFALAYAALFARSERRRVGFYAVLVGVAFGTLGVLVGLHFAFAGVSPALVGLHFRLNVLGFLGLTIVGATYQFYPPTVGTFPGASDRTALASVALVGAGLLVEAVGAFAGSGTGATAVVGGSTLALVGRTLALAGTALFAGLVGGVFVER